MLKRGTYEQLLNDGVDESGEELVAMGGVDKLVNGFFRREGGITRRNAFVFPTVSTVGTDPKNGGSALLANGGSLTAVRKLDTLPLSDSVFNGFSDYAAKKFVALGTVESVAQLRDGRGFKNCNAAVEAVNSRTVAVLVGQMGNDADDETADKLMAIAVECNTGAVLATATWTGRRARPVFRGSTCCIFYESYSSGWEIKLTRWNFSGNGEFEHLSTVINNEAKADGDFGMAPDSSTFVYLSWTEGGTTLRTKKVSTSASISASRTDTVPASTDTVALVLSTQYPTILHIVYADGDGGGDVSILGVPSSLSGAALGGPTTALSAVSADGFDWEHLSVVELGASGERLVVTGAAGVPIGGSTHAVSTAKVVTAQLSATSAPLYTVLNTKTLLNTLLLAHPLLVYPDDSISGATVTTPHLLLSRFSDTPDTYSDRTSQYNAVLQCLPFGNNFNASAPTPVPGGFGSDHTLLSATALAGTAYNGSANDRTAAVYPHHILAQPSYNNTEKTYYVPVLDLEEQGTTTTAIFGIKLLRFKFNSTGTQTPPRAAIGSLLYVGGNQLRFYDGVDVGEAVPVYPPQAPSVTMSAGGNLDASATYLYSFVLVWEDYKGLVHRSAPTPAITVTTTAGNKTATLAWEANEVLHTALNEVTTARVWRLEVYRSEGNDSVLYLEQVVSYQEGSAVSVVSSALDSTITSNKVLYTTGNVLANNHPPALKSLTAVGNRLWGISAADPRNIIYSKELAEGYAAEFNPVLQLRLDASESEPVAVAGLDDLLVVFTEREAWAISTHGGPDATGAGTFGLFERLATNCGASGPNAAVSTPIGVLVHTSSGMRLLTRGGALDVPLVADSASGSYTVLAAAHMPERQEVWYVFAGGSVNRIVVFSYARGKLRWYNWDLTVSGATPAVRDIVNLDGTPYVLVYYSNSYKLMKLSTTSYLDGSTEFIPVTVRTRWFKPEGHMADGRFWRVHVLGGAGNNGLQVKTYVMDTSGSPLDDDSSDDWLRGTWSWTSVQLANDNRAIHVRRTLGSQRGAAARVEITLTAPSSGSSNVQGPVLHAVAWDFGVRGALAPRGATYEAT